MQAAALLNQSAMRATACKQHTYLVVIYALLAHIRKRRLRKIHLMEDRLSSTASDSRA